MNDELFVWWRMIEEELSDLIGAEIYFTTDSESAAFFVEDAEADGVEYAYQTSRDMLVNDFKALGSLEAVRAAFPRMVVVEEVYDV